ncbi:MAG: V-type ATP synthase subunit F [Gammaproteobacteria bacterium]|jgi:vacuolar-type H+-ATPase subunit F/Vma7
MTAPVFIGDEVTAAGFRLAGVRIRTPAREDLLAELSWARRNASLILITAEYAAMLDAEEQQQAVTQMEPPLVVLPDIRVETPVQDLATHLRSQLGVLE